MNKLPCISDYRGGDESNPASPYYEEKDEDAAYALIADAESSLRSASKLLESMAGRGQAVWYEEDMKRVRHYLRTARMEVEDALEAVGVKL